MIDNEQADRGLARKERQPFSAQKLGQLLKKHWWIPILSGFIAGAAMIAYMLVADPIYESTMVISARPSDSKNFSLSSLAQGAGSDLLGSVAAGLGGLEDANFGEFKGLLTSRPVAQQLWGHEDLMRQVFYKRFDRQRNTWKKPGGVGSLRRNFNAMFGVITDDKPGVDDVQNFLMRSVLITDDRKSGLTTLVVRARSKQLAERLVEFVANSADSALRTASQKRSSQYIQYIESKLNTVTFNNRRDALIRLLDQQESSAMISQVGVPFAAQFLSKPLTGDEPSSPRPIPFLLIALFCGVLIGIGIVLSLDYLGISMPALEAVTRDVQKATLLNSTKELKKSGTVS